MFMYPAKVSSKHKSNLFKSLSPKLTLRRECMAENLKYKAEELIMKRIQKESFDKIINQNIEDINLNENDTTKDIICSQMAHDSKELFRIRSLQQSKYNNDNVDKDYSLNDGLNSTTKCLSILLNEDIARLIDEKRSTINEQIEDEDNYTNKSKEEMSNFRLIEHNSKESEEINQIYKNEELKKCDYSILRKYSEEVNENKNFEITKLNNKRERILSDDINKVSLFHDESKELSRKTSPHAGSCYISKFQCNLNKNSDIDRDLSDTVASTPLNFKEK